MNNQPSAVSPEQCPGYQGCAAPLCYMDKSLSQAVWYPGEPVCKLRKVPKWVKVQRRVAKALGIPKDSDSGQEDLGAFTVQMFEAVRAVTSKVRGLDLESETVEGWLNKRHSSGVSCGNLDTTKNLDTPGPSFAPSAPKQPITEGQMVAI